MGVTISSLFALAKTHLQKNDDYKEKFIDLGLQSNLLNYVPLLCLVYTMRLFWQIVFVFPPVVFDA